MNEKKACTILIVDDSDEDRETYKAFLTQNNQRFYTFFEADNISTALAIFRQVTIDCILLDYHLPDQDGLEILDKFCGPDGKNHNAVVMITGRGNEKIAVEALKKGAQDYLVKSMITPESLFRATENAIEKLNNKKLLLRRYEEKERAEYELRQSEERFRLLVEGVKDYAIIMLDIHGHIVSWNAGARNLLDCHDHQAIGRHFRMFFMKDDIKAGIPELELHNARVHGRANDERWHVRKNGEVFWASGLVTPIFDETNTLRGFAKILRDVTEHKLAAQEQELLLNKLIESEEKLKEAVSVRDEFLTVASHEFKTPLTALIIKIQHALRTLTKSAECSYPKEKMIETLLEANNQIKRLSTLVEDLLEVSKFNSKSFPFTLEKIEFNSLIEQLVEHFRIMTERTGVKLDFKSLHPQPLIAYWERSRIEQIFNNLISNAIKYGEGKPINVEVDCDLALKKVYLKVTDHGMGIIPEHQDKIFERFERAVNSSSISGLGLGLYIVKQILEGLGGSVQVQSTLGQGSTFIVELPIKEQA